MLNKYRKLECKGQGAKLMEYARAAANTDAKKKVRLSGPAVRVMD